MTKEELINVVHDRSGVDFKCRAERAVNVTFDQIGAVLIGGNSFRMPGFGTFSVRHRAARRCRNPKTGEIMQVPAKRVVVFKAARKLAEEVNP